MFLINNLFRVQFPFKNILNFKVESANSYESLNSALLKDGLNNNYVNSNPYLSMAEETTSLNNL